MARITLLSPPYIDLYGKLGRCAGRYFPLGLGYIASYLRKYGDHTVSLYEPEAQGLSYDDIGRILLRESPEIVGIGSATPNFPRALRLAALARKHTRARIVLGGVHATAIPEFIMTRHADLIDCVVCGEGERTMLDLADNRELADIPGIVYRDGDQVRRTPVRPFIEELDTIPPPARDLIPQGLFRPNAHNVRYKECMTILTSRGCPYNCSFCAARLTSGTRYRTHSAEYVLDEMQMLVRDYGARQIIITDDTFTLNRARLEAILKGMIDLRLGLSWFCFSQVNAVDRATLSLMKRAGCYNIGFGIESSNPETLRRMGKNIRPEDALRAVHDANALGIKTQAFYVLGMPGETLAQMEDTVKFAARVGSTLAFFNMLVPFPGTRDFERFFGDMPLEEVNWEDFVAIGERCVLRGNPEVAPELIERMIARANLTYYASAARIIDILTHIRTPLELANYMAGGWGVLRQALRWKSGSQKK